MQSNSQKIQINHLIAYLNMLFNNSQTSITQVICNQVSFSLIHTLSLPSLQIKSFLFISKMTDTIVKTVESTTSDIVEEIIERADEKKCHEKETLGEEIGCNLDAVAEVVEEKIEEAADCVEKKVDSNLVAFRTTLTRSLEKMGNTSTSIWSTMTCGMFGKPKTGEDQKKPAEKQDSCCKEEEKKVQEKEEKTRE